jgi:hypothetical protein
MFFAIAGRSGQRQATHGASPFVLCHGTTSSRAMKDGKRIWAKQAAKNSPKGTHNSLTEGHGFSRAKKAQQGRRLQPLGYGFSRIRNRHCKENRASAAKAIPSVELVRHG